MPANTRDWQTRIRLLAAMIQGGYAIIYLAYYAVGLISADAMENYNKIFNVLWPLTWLVTLVFSTHIVLGLWKVFRRNTFKMPAWEMAQILIGISIPFFLVPHFAATYAQGWLYGVQENYVDDILLTFPDLAWQFIALTLAIGIHGQIGSHTVLRLRPWYPRFRWLIVVVLTLIPLLSIGGYVKTGLELHAKQVSGQLAEDDRPHLPNAAQTQTVRSITYGTYIFFGSLYVVVLVGRGIRLRLRSHSKLVTVYYPSGKTVSVFPSTTLLEASRIGGIPHASICGGRGRCTTCRVKVEQGMESLSAVGERERKALRRIEAAPDVRLACQSECLRDEVKITLLLPPQVKAGAARKETANTIGRDIAMVVMFADLRGFTHMSEGKFPYDVVFTLNRYFQSMGEAIESNNGTIDKFMGDGILAYFGLKGTPQEACRNAIQAARKMAEQLVDVNNQIKDVLNEPLKIGIGLHYGDVILGEIGYRSKSSLTIIGDTVNTASRLEALNKRTGSQMIVSSTVAATAGLDLSYLKIHTAQVRGKTEPLRVYVIPNILSDLHMGTLI